MKGENFPFYQSLGNPIIVMSIKLTLIMLDIFMYNNPPQFYPIKWQDSSILHEFKCVVESNVDLDQLAS